MSANLKQKIRSFRQIFHQPIIALAVINVAIAMLAFVKDVVLAAYTGTSLQADALTLAFFIPDSIGNNLFAAAISVVCIPIFSDWVAINQKHLLQISIKQVAIRFLSIAVILMAVGYWSAGWVSRWLGHSSSIALSHATLPLLQILLPTIMLFVLAAISTAILQTLHRFITAAVAPLLFNFIFLCGVVYCIISKVALTQGVLWIAIVITAGECLVAVWMVMKGYHALRQLHDDPNANRAKIQMDHAKEWRKMMRSFLPYLLILLSIQAVYFAERHLITAFESGAAAALNYAFRLTQLPVWVFVAAISVVILPALSRHVLHNRSNEIQLMLKNSFRAVVLVIFPSMAFLFLLREPLTIGLFQRGAFDMHSVALTSSILKGYSLSVFSQSISLICLRYMLAARQLMNAMFAFLSTSLLTIIMDYLLSKQFGPSGIGYGAALGAMINAMILLYILWGNIRPNLLAVKKELMLYIKAIISTAIAFSIARAFWFLIPSHQSGAAIIFILAAGCLFISGYSYVLRPYWHEFKRGMSAK